MNDEKFSEWRKSSRSNSSGDCVEVAFAAGRVRVRDSKRAGQGPELEFTSDQWQMLVAGVKRGDLGPR